MRFTHTGIRQILPSMYLHTVQANMSIKVMWLMRGELMMLKGRYMWMSFGGCRDEINDEFWEKKLKSNKWKRIVLKQNSPICWSQPGVTGRKKGASTRGKEGSEFSPAVSLFSSFPSLFLFLSLPRIHFFIHPSHFLHLHNNFFPSLFSSSHVLSRPSKKMCKKSKLTTKIN